MTLYQRVTVDFSSAKIAYEFLEIRPNIFKRWFETLQTDREERKDEYHYTVDLKGQCHEKSC